MNDLEGQVWELPEDVHSPNNPHMVTLAIVGRNDVEPSVRCLVLNTTWEWTPHKVGEQISVYAGWFFGTHPKARRIA